MLVKRIFSIYMRSQCPHRYTICLLLWCFITAFSLGHVLGAGEIYGIKTLVGNTSPTYFDLTLMYNAKHAYMQDPCGICLGIHDDMYVSDCGRHLIFRIFANESMKVVGGLGFAGKTNDGYAATETLFNTPSSVGVAPNGDLFIAETNNDKIRIVSSSTGLVSSIPHTFNKPLGLFVSSNNIVYIADTGNNLIKKYDLSSGILSTLGGGGYLDGTNDNVDAKLLVLKSPTNIHVVSNGKSDTVYFTDNEKVKSIDSEGMYRLVDGELSNFYGIHVSSSNEIWTCSSNSHFIQRKTNGDSQTTTIIGGMNLPDYSGDGLVDSYAQVRFFEPTSLVMKNAILYVTDKSNNCIRKIDTVNKIVTTFSGGLINHPFGEDLPPLEMSPTSYTRAAISYQNDLYFVENNILRKLSNGVVKTILGCSLELKTPTLLTRTLFSVNSVYSFGNGELTISAEKGVYVLNLSTLVLTQLSSIGSFYISGCGNSVSNGSVFFVDNQYEKLYRYKNGTISGPLPLSNMYSLTVHSDNCIVYTLLNFRITKLDFDQPTSSYETIPTPLLTTNPVTIWYYNERLYFAETVRIYEMKLSDYSYKLIAGLNTYNVSGSLVSFTGYTGENIPVLESALEVITISVHDEGRIIVNNRAQSFGYISEISNGQIKSIVGRPVTKYSRILSAFTRDEDENIIYFLDSRVLKMYNESSGISTNLTPAVSTLQPVVASQINNPLPLFFTGTNTLLKALPILTFSKFDKMLYLIDTCRMLQIDPSTMKYSKVAGIGCGTIVPDISALNSPFPISSIYGFTSNPENGDLYFASLGIMYRLEKSSGFIRILFESPSTSVSSPDGLVTPSTSIGSIQYFTLVRGDIYFATEFLIRVLEKQSGGGYYLRTKVGNGLSGYTGDNLPALQSSLSSVASFSVKQNGDMIIFDGGAFLIRKYVKSTGILKDIAGSPNQNTIYYFGDLKGKDITFMSLAKSISVNEKTEDIYLMDGRTTIRKLAMSCDGMSVYSAINNTCICLNGYYGEKCEPYTCNGTLASNSLTCNGNGQCTGVDVCVCKDGYTGKYCQTLSLMDGTIIIAIVVPIVGCLLFIVVATILIVLLSCCLVKKRNRRAGNEIATIDEKNIELFEFQSKRSIVLSSSNMGSSIASDNEDAFSRYSNIVRIGQGAFGSVYRVTDIKQGNKVKAVKLIQFQTFSDLNSIMKEASQLTHIKHPNILKVNDYFVTNDNLLCIDMDYYDQGDLTRFFKEDCPEGTLKQIIRQMCEALNYVSSQLSIIHRDIKPSNIFIKRLSDDLSIIEIVLADFGLAKKYQEMNGQSYAGTPIYMSPEIALGSSYSFNTDIFSLGVSIYQIMTKETTTSISGLVMSNPNVQSILTNNIKQSNVQYSDDLIQILFQMLDKNPQTRPLASHLLSLPYFNE